MIYQPKLPPAPVQQSQAMSELERALGDHNKIQSIKQRMNANYPPPQAPQKKVFSSRPDSVDL